MTKLNSNITRFLGGVTQGKLGKKNITVQVGRIDNAVLGTDGKPKVRYRLVVNGKESKYLIRSWQGAYQVHQIVASGDAKEIFTQAGDLKKGMDDIIGTDAIRSVFDYICPINLSPFFYVHIIQRYTSNILYIIGTTYLIILIHLPIGLH